MKKVFCTMMYFMIVFFFFAFGTLKAQSSFLSWNFESYSIGDSLAHIGWSPSDIQAVVAQDPLNSANKVLENIIHNYDAAPVLRYILPAGKTLADFGSFTFQGYFAQGDVGYKHIVVEAYQTMPTGHFLSDASAKIGDWNRAQMGSTSWENITVNITNTSSFKDTIYIAFGISCAGTGSVGAAGDTTIWYADSVTLVPKPPPVAIFAASKNSIDFGSDSVGIAKKDSVNIYDPGTDTLKVTSISSTNALFTFSPSVFTIAPSDTSVLTITFTPHDTSSQSGFIILTHNAAGSPDSISAKGSGLPGTVPITKYLTHSWPFDNGTANDYVGHANGTLVGGASIGEGALVTSAQGQWMSMPGDSIALNTYSEITLEAWYTPNIGANPNFTMLAFFGNTQNTVGVNYYFMTAARLDTVSRTAISCDNTSTPWSAETGVNGPEYDDGKLHHMVSTLTKDTIKLYIDGTLTGAKQLDTNNSISRISPVFAYLARSGYTGDAQWIGQIHMFNIYNKALDSAEVLSLFKKGVPTRVNKEIGGMPKEYSLSQNYPNPFNPTTVIGYQLPVTSKISLKVYDLLGQEVATLFEGVRQPGKYQATFDGSRLASGVYFCRLTANSYMETKKLLLIK